MGRHTYHVLVKFKHASNKLNTLLENIGFGKVGIDSPNHNGWQFVFDAAEDYKDKNKNEVLCDVAIKKIGNKELKIFIVNEAEHSCIGHRYYCAFSDNKSILLQFMKDMKLGVKITANDVVQQTI